jgi:GMP reductase
MECADAAHGIGGHIMADGGCQCSGDVAKAFGAGADFVMLGGMLAGHRECGGEVFYHEGVAYREFYGMSSSKAMLRHTGEVANYRAAEGKSMVLPCKGDVEKTMRDILGGVRSACTYMGAKTIKDMAKCTTFVRANRQINTMFG